MKKFLVVICAFLLLTTSLTAEDFYNISFKTDKLSTFILYATNIQNRQYKTPNTGIEEKTGTSIVVTYTLMETIALYALFIVIKKYIRTNVK